MQYGEIDRSGGVPEFFFDHLMKNVFVADNPFRDCCLLDSPRSISLAHLKCDPVISRITNVYRKKNAAIMIAMLSEIEFSQAAIRLNKL